MRLGWFALQRRKGKGRVLGLTVGKYSIHVRIYIGLNHSTIFLQFV